MSNISKCENCGCEKIDVIHKYKGHYVCPKCGRDTERLYEIDHDAKIKDEVINKFAKTSLEELHQYQVQLVEKNHLGQMNDIEKARLQIVMEKVKLIIEEIAEQMKAGGAE